MSEGVVRAGTGLLLGLFLLCAGASGSAETRSLSQGWLFRAGEAKGAEEARFDDRGWDKVAVPHDWSVMDRPDGRPPFDPQAEAGQDAGYLPGGIGWYRHHLTLAPDEAAKVVRLNFEAVYMDADVWLNGTHLTRHRYGYTAFSVDLTGKVRAGDNVIVVRANHVDPSSRWYAGSGLIRPITLDILDRVHLDPDSIFVTTPVATQVRGSVSVSAAVVNRASKPRKAELVARLVSPQGATVAEARQSRALAADARAEVKQSFELADPALWSPDAPNLYTLVQEVRIAGAPVDVRRTRFGIRTIKVDAREGLTINGNPVKLRGGNIHHDNYMIGAAGPPAAEARKVALMKAAGYNAIRSAHNPASQATLDAADALGMLVIDEAFDSWNKSKRPHDYTRFFAEDWAGDIDSMVISGRNHPSVLFWSIGNEILETGTEQGLETGRRLLARVRTNDPTRMVTQAINSDPPLSTAQAAILDVAGYNYRVGLFAGEHQKLPEKVMLTTESMPKDAFAYWRAVETMPWVIGDFVWTSVDYLGETGIGWMGYSQDGQKLGPFPWHLAYCGEIDATGRKRPAAYYRQVLWKSGIDPVAAFVRQPEGTADLPDRYLFPIVQPHPDWSLEDVHPSWSWAGQEGRPLEVVVYSELPEVELFLNGRSLGRKPASVETKYIATYTVPYAAGRLVAVGYRDGREAARWTLRTAGKPADVAVSPDRQQIAADGEDLAYVTVELRDADGTPIYAREGDRTVRVRVSGAGMLAGIGNGNPMDASSFQAGVRRTFHGRLVAAVRAGTAAGPIVVEVEADGLPARRVQIDGVTARMQ